MKVNNYEDSSEDFILSFFDKPQSKKQKEIWKILSNNPSWPIIYHLHPQRQLLLSWYPFRKNSTLLEIGAGCGALTGMFCKRVNKVVANELTLKRAQIIKKRWGDKKNLKILMGNFNKINIKEKYDYITLIGVLEYQGKYTRVKKNDEEEKYVLFLKKIKKCLNKDGVLLIAIENKIGLKYLCGGKEDHYGNLFESIENYPDYQGVKTFTKEEIKNILKKAGFNYFNFYYPYPDYKLPQIVINESSFRKINLYFSSYLPIVDLSNSRDFIFNEVVLGYLLDKEEILEKFANSFLIEAKI